MRRDRIQKRTARANVPESVDFFFAIVNSGKAPGLGFDIAACPLHKRFHDTLKDVAVFLFVEHAPGWDDGSGDVSLEGVTRLLEPDDSLVLCDCELRDDHQRGLRAAREMATALILGYFLHRDFAALLCVQRCSSCGAFFLDKRGNRAYCPGGRCKKRYERGVIAPPAGSSSIARFQTVSRWRPIAGNPALAKWLLPRELLTIDREQLLAHINTELNDHLTEPAARRAFIRRWRAAGIRIFRAGHTGRKS